MNIIANISEIKYKPILKTNIKVFGLSNFNINEMPSYFILNYENKNLAISKWVSPKRTRSYPYERVYNTLSFNKKVTIIPIVKDEGKLGDRDYLQWDTISLMSLLDVYVIFAYYKSAVPNKNKTKITKQKFENDYILNKIDEINSYHSSALHWNINELKNNLTNIIKNVIESYNLIAKKTNIELHDNNGLENYQNKINSNLNEFMNFSREKAISAQKREYLTVQPKEKLDSISKAKLTISNYLGGFYYFTTDEISIKKKEIDLIESKYSKYSLLPSLGDIKDGLIKMVLYSNFDKCYVNNKVIKSNSVLILSSEKLKGEINSKTSIKDIDYFFGKNNFKNSQKELVNNLIEESILNNFELRIKSVK